jgi:hypothetical protein|tara:strand:+ start:501 stop:752 length:252 start_codon:yes stop_codon:yes gene_type:complete
MTPPIIHLNGTSREALTEGYIDAYHALHSAREALQETAPNARDFYVSPDPSAYTKARGEHDSRLASINMIMTEVMALAEAVSE